MPPQFINAPDGTPLFVVLPYEEFKSMEKPATTTEASSSLLSPDGLSIRLPNGGPGATLDLVQFVDAWVRRGTVSMVINKRQQTYDKFPPEQLVNSLDPVLRRCFLPKDSPYRDTMQATSEVVDALVETGLFSHSMERWPGFYRPVKCIRINEEKALAFHQKHGKPAVQVDIHEFVIP